MIVIPFIMILAMIVFLARIAENTQPEPEREKLIKKQDQERKEACASFMESVHYWEKRKADKIREGLDFLNKH